MQPVEAPRPEDVVRMLASVAEFAELAGHNAAVLDGQPWSRAEESARISDAAQDLLTRTAG